MNDGAKSAGAVALVSGGIASAFALAACCALPFLLAGVGIGSAWLAPIVSASQPFANLLTAVSAVALAGAVLLVWRAPARCSPGSLCARPAFRRAVTGAAALGAILLILAQVYG
ncbi:MAG TPA: mercuric transporter MerT family protein [Sphingomicrobium sp.]|nr:mercuric transporter MerT family protein [Sphingomicrobium sp.]